MIGVFREYSVYDLSDKSVNGHTCRKSSLLSQMFIFHKLITKFEEKVDMVEKFFVADLQAYLTLFVEVQSMVFDIVFYF